MSQSSYRFDRATNVIVIVSVQSRGGGGGGHLKSSRLYKLSIRFDNRPGREGRLQNQNQRSGFEHANEI